MENGTTLSPTLPTDNPKKIESSILSARELPSLPPSLLVFLPERIGAPSRIPPVLVPFLLTIAVGPYERILHRGREGSRVSLFWNEWLSTPPDITKSAHTGAEKSEEEPCSSSLLPSTIVIKHWNYIYLVAESEK